VKLRVVPPEALPFLARARRVGKTENYEETVMMKVVRCRDVGFDCNGVVRAPTEEEALKQVAVHAKEVHGVDPVTPDMVQKVKSVMREERE
jgi:predicted small metal-binding protein